MQRDQERPTMDAFGDKLKKTVERYLGILLALVLLGALWSTALGRLSEQSTAETLLTRAGTDIINPVLTANNSGIGEAFYQQLQGTAKRAPQHRAPDRLPESHVPGKAIAGKSFADGSRVIYAAVADAYYRLGPNGVFALPPQLQQVVSGYTPFVQQATSGVKSPLPSLPIPQLPAFATNLYTTVGITPTTLTAEGHATSTSRSLWFWLIAGVLALILVLMNTGWDRLWSIAWPLFHSSWHIALFGLIATVLVNVKAAASDTLFADPHAHQWHLHDGLLRRGGLGIALVIVSMVGNRVAPAGRAEGCTTRNSPRRRRMRHQPTPTTPPRQQATRHMRRMAAAIQHRATPQLRMSQGIAPHPLTAEQPPMSGAASPSADDAPPPAYPSQNPPRP